MTSIRERTTYDGASSRVGSRSECSRRDRAMIELCALFDAFLVTLGAIVSFSLALRQTSGRARAFLVRSQLGIWWVAFLPMLVESGDWVHLTWSGEVPLVCLFLLSGALLFTVWPEDAEFFAPYADPRFERAPPPRIGPAWWFLAMMLSLGAT